MNHSFVHNTHIDWMIGDIKEYALRDELLTYVRDFLLDINTSVHVCNTKSVQLQPCTQCGESKYLRFNIIDCSIIVYCARCSHGLRIPVYKHKPIDIIDKWNSFCRINR